METKDKRKIVSKEEIIEKRIKPTLIRRRSAVESGRKAVGGKAKLEEIESKEKVEEEERKPIKEDETRVESETVEKKEAVRKKTITPGIERKKRGTLPPVVAKEVIVFPPKKQPKKKTFHKKSVYGRGRLYEPRERRRDRMRIPPPSRKLKKTEITVTKAAKKVIRISDVISISDLSQRIGVKGGDIIKKLMSLGIMATINQLIDVDAATLIAQEFGYNVEKIAPQEEMLIEGETGKGAKSLIRSPVVTVMGHVDHGKTSLLDAIRKTNVTKGEFGNITQHIGAYHVHLEKGDITFLDTPGHEAFTAMRARGAQVTDIVVLVVAADDGVMPQTVEAINHAKAAGVPVIVAVNKIDVPNADPQKVKQELSQHGLVPEEWGGDTIFIEVSAKKGTNIQKLLESILLEAEMLELKANPQRPGRGVVIESKLDKGRGPVATVLVKDGSIRVGDVVVSGIHWGRIRAMVDDLGRRMKKAGPSVPVEIVGLSGVPEVSKSFYIVKDEATAKQIADIRIKKRQTMELGKTAKISLEDLYEKIKDGEIKELNVIIKGDVHGSVEAVKDNLLKLSTDKVKVNIMHDAVGAITEGDILLASASNAIIIGFNVRYEPKAHTLAGREGVDVRLYNIIYDVEEDIRKAMEGMLAPLIKEKITGRAEVREIFKVAKVGVIAGSYVIDGKMKRGSKLHLIRDGIVVYDGKLLTLRRFKEDVKEVTTGYECGITIEGYNDIKVGDIIETYIQKEVAAKL